MPTPVTMPALSPTMTEGTLAKWHKKEGDTVSAGDVIAEIETDKATMEVEAVDEGVLGKILINEGTENVPVNEVIALLLEDGEDKAELENYTSNDNGSKKTEKPAEETRESAKPDIRKTASQAPDKGTDRRIFASPLARRIAEQNNVDLSAIRGSGPHGRIIKADVLGAKSGGAPQALSEKPIQVDEKTNEFGMVYREIPNNNIKKITAKRLLESKQTVPHFYLTIECTLDDLLTARKQINDHAKGAYKLSVNDFIVKAAALAARDFPAVNVSWNENAIYQYRDVDVSVAVATPNGLMTPIVKRTDEKRLQDISAEIKDLASRAQEGKLKPQEFQGGTFTVSNLGMFGIKEFGAIINPPQSCILAVGAGVEKPVVENGEIVIRTMMTCTLSVDHRSVDGAVGAEYLKIFKTYIENPVTMLL